MNLTSRRFKLPAVLVAAVTSLLLPLALRAADHGDAPALAHDQGADIADVFAFMDPTTGIGATAGKADVILIATFHGFIVPGEASNFGVFDHNIRYRFEIYNDHVNNIPVDPGSGATNAQKVAFARAKAKYVSSIKANRTIDVTFSKRATDPADTSILKRPAAQTATVTLGGFTPRALNKKFTTTDSGGAITTTAPTLRATANPQIKNTIDVSDTASIDVFAGIVDDPFFFDIPGFQGFIDSVRNPMATPDFSLARGRDTFAGYNILAIAIRIPKALLVNSDAMKSRIGVDFLTQRRTVQMPGNDGVKASGAFKTVDRMGNPGINVVLLPFDRKNAYNTGTPKQDATLKFGSDILGTLGQLGVDADSPNTTALNTLLGIAVTAGDLLQLDTNVTNVQTGAGGGGNNAGVGFGTAGGGRRLMDDTIDTFLKVVTGSPAAGDAVAFEQDAGFGAIAAFPFLSPPHQPRPANAGAEDNTRN